MAEDSDLEKTESATPRRLQKAREEGQIVRSRELSTFALLAAGFYGTWAMSGHIGMHLQDMLRASLMFNHDSTFDTSHMLIGAGAGAALGAIAGGGRGAAIGAFSGGPYVEECVAEN